MSGDLAGWTVVVTRAEGEGGPLGAALERHGATVLRVPTVEVGPPGDAGPLDDALGALDGYDWIVFTSPRAVDAVAGRVAALPRALSVAVVGPSTAERAGEAGFEVTRVGGGEGARGLAEELVGSGVGAGVRVLFPASDRARPDLVDTLRAAGASVDRVVAYATRVRSFDPGAVPGLDRADVVTFTSPSAVEGWHSAIGLDSTRLVPEGVRFVAIGATTATKLEFRGVERAVVAPEASLDGVVEAVRALRAAAR